MPFVDSGPAIHQRLGCWLLIMAIKWVPLAAIRRALQIGGLTVRVGQFASEAVVAALERGLPVVISGLAQQHAPALVVGCQSKPACW